MASPRSVRFWHPLPIRSPPAIRIPSSGSRRGRDGAWTHAVEGRWTLLPPAAWRRRRGARRARRLAAASAMGSRLPRRLPQRAARDSVARNPLGPAPPRSARPDPRRSFRYRRDGRTVRRRDDASLVATAPTPRERERRTRGLATVIHGDEQLVIHRHAAAGAQVKQLDCRWLRPRGCSRPSE